MKTGDTSLSPRIVFSKRWCLSILTDGWGPDAGSPGPVSESEQMRAWPPPVKASWPWGQQSSASHTLSCLAWLTDPSFLLLDLPSCLSSIMMPWSRFEKRFCPAFLIVQQEYRSELPRPLEGEVLKVPLFSQWSEITTFRVKYGNVLYFSNASALPCVPTLAGSPVYLSRVSPTLLCDSRGAFLPREVSPAVECRLKSGTLVP